MKTSSFVLVGLATAALVNVGRSVSLADGTSAPQAPASDTMDALRNAKDPSAAIEAYSAAALAHPGDVGVPAAYVRKMVEFGLPEMAEKQALDLTLREPTNGLAWAVAAYMDARHDKPADALEKVATAVSRTPDDPFVLRTAGQLVAWYDTRAEKDKVPAPLRDAVEKLKTDLGPKPGYAEPYRMAREAYSQGAGAAPGAQPKGEPAAPVAGPAPLDGAGPLDGPREETRRDEERVIELPSSEPREIVREETIIIEREPVVERVYVPQTTYVYTDPFIGSASPFVCDPWWPSAFSFHYDRFWSWNWNWRPCFQSVVLIGDHCNDWRRDRWNWRSSWDRRWDGRRDWNYRSDWHDDWARRDRDDHRWSGDRHDGRWDGRHDGQWDGRHDGTWSGSHDGTWSGTHGDGRYDGSGRHDGRYDANGRHDGDGHRWNGDSDRPTTGGTTTVPGTDPRPTTRPGADDPDGRRRGRQDEPRVRGNGWTQDRDRTRPDRTRPDRTRDQTAPVRIPDAGRRNRTEETRPVYRTPDRGGFDRQRVGPTDRMNRTNPLRTNPGVNRVPDQSPQRVRAPQRIQAPARTSLPAPARPSAAPRPSFQAPRGQSGRGPGRGIDRHGF